MFKVQPKIIPHRSTFDLEIMSPSNGFSEEIVDAPSKCTFSLGVHTFWDLKPGSHLYSYEMLSPLGMPFVQNFTHWKGKKQTEEINLKFSICYYYSAEPAYLLNLASVQPKCSKCCPILSLLLVPSFVQQGQSAHERRLCGSMLRVCGGFLLSNSTKPVRAA